MAIQYQASNIHWNYFLAIEKDFENISRYVEFSEANHTTFSIEFARIIMASSQEIDGILKKICAILEEGSNPHNINEYREIVTKSLNEMIREEVFALRFGMSSQPWVNWNAGINPDWWKANNNIKHDRTEHLKDANLINAFNSVGALLITTSFYYKLNFERQAQRLVDWQEIMDNLKPVSSLFSLDSDKYFGLVKVGRSEW